MARPANLYQLDTARTTWHITWGTYGTRLHGGERATVDRRHNQRGWPFITFDPPRYEACRERMRFPPVNFTIDQRRFIETMIPDLCLRGGWSLRMWAAQSDHVHVVADIVPAVHGEQARRLLKRWMTQALNEIFTLTGESWWAEEGSNKPVDDHEYLGNVIG